MALSVGPRVSCFLLQILSNILDGIALEHFFLFFFSLWEHLLIPVKLYARL